MLNLAKLSSGLRSKNGAKHDMNVSDFGDVTDRLHGCNFCCMVAVEIGRAAGHLSFNMLHHGTVRS